MNHFEFMTNNLIESGEPRGRKGLARAYCDLKELELEADVVSRLAEPQEAARLQRRAWEARKQLMASEGGYEFLIEMERDSLAVPLNTDKSPEAQALMEANWERSPEKAFAIMVDVLRRAVGAMQTIVDETRRDHIEFEIRGRQIDRTLARTQEILDGLLAEPQ